MARNSIFDDDLGESPAAASASASSLFADDVAGAGDSPWDLPTPKKGSRADLVKTLLPASDVPESYVDIFDALLALGEKRGAGVSLTGVKKTLGAGGLSPDDQARILEIVMPGGHESATGFGREEFNTLLALIGLAQEKEDITLDGVDERRKNLPEPSLPSLTTAKHAQTSESPPTPTLQPPATPPSKPAGGRPSPSRPRDVRKDSMDFPEVDPWGSPALHKGHNHADGNGSTPRTKSAGRSGNLPRTVSTLTSSSAAPDGNPSPMRDAGRGGWAGDDSAGNPTFSTPSGGAIGGNGFGGPSDDDGDLNNAGTPGRSIGGGRVTARGVEEVVVVTVLPEKEGMFMFQHRNYQVSSARRASKVIRRYSDFVWLLNCLQKRYPFRQLPLLPPKRVAVNGNHLSSDASFIEKRRRGLARFTNSLVRHPVLNQEQLVIMFLTVPTELSVWRKQATISVQEEFTGKALPPTLEDSLPTNLNETFDTVRSGIRRSAEIYINLCNLLERLAKRNEGVAADYLRLSLSLQSLTEVSASTYAVDTNDVPMLNSGLDATAKHLSASQSLLEDEARAWDEGVLEDLKRQRDALVSAREMFDRAERLSKDTIPALERKIESNESKLAGLRGRPRETLKPGEIEKVEDAIIHDKQSIVAQHARGVFIKECLRDELSYFQHSQYHVSRLHQDWSQERVKYAELQADNWRSLNEEVEGMPVGE
ncbi:MAG: Sorting nexin mvp1 [Thelocarpon impressellum]|nr:MAG: Sorting nexin mvp1 [Thelocarpon impressellum]